MRSFIQALAEHSLAIIMLFQQTVSVPCTLKISVWLHLHSYLDYQGCELVGTDASEFLLDASAGEIKSKDEVVKADTYLIQISCPGKVSHYMYFCLLI